MRAASSGLTLSQSVAFLMEMRGRPAATNRSSRGGREAEAEENRGGTGDQEEELLPSLLVNSRPAFTLFWCQSRCRKFPEKDETVRFCCSDMNLSHMTSSSLQLRLVGGWGWRGGGVSMEGFSGPLHPMPSHGIAWQRAARLQQVVAMEAGTKAPPGCLGFSVCVPSSTHGGADRRGNLSFLLLQFHM